MLRAILETAYTPDDNDLFLSNVAHTPIWAIHGYVARQHLPCLVPHANSGDDDNVPAWHTREAVAVVKTWNPAADITFAFFYCKYDLTADIIKKDIRRMQG
jgi:hypothetical protein